MDILQGTGVEFECTVLKKYDCPVKAVEDEEIICLNQKKSTRRKQNTTMEIVVWLLLQKNIILE